MANSPVRAGIGLNLDAWRDEPECERRAMAAFPLRGAFIITKLLQTDTLGLRAVMAYLYRAFRRLRAR